MPITLEYPVGAGVTPIPNNDASAIAFANNYTKLVTLSKRDVLTISLIQMIHYVADGGVDYRSNHAGLIQDGAVFTRGLNIEFDLVAALAAWQQGWAMQVNNGMSDDIPTILAEGRDFANLSEDELRRLLVTVITQT